MNERIRELATEVGMSVEYLESTKQIVLIERFAELIVRECANIDFRREVGLTADDDYEISKVIKVHFGVEE